MDSSSSLCEHRGSSHRLRRVAFVSLAVLTLGGLPVDHSGVFGPSTAVAEQDELSDARDSARAAMDSSNWRQAIDAWTSVLALDPNDAEAKAGLKQAQAMLDQASTIDNVQDDFTLRRQRVSEHS